MKWIAYSYYSLSVAIKRPFQRQAGTPAPPEYSRLLLGMAALIAHPFLAMLLLARRNTL